MSDYNLSLDAPKSNLETEKTLKTLSSGKKTPKNPKKPKKTIQKKQKKKTKKPLDWVFFKPGFFPTLPRGAGR